MDSQPIVIDSSIRVAKRVDFYFRYRLKIDRHLPLLRTAILLDLLIVSAASLATCQVTGTTPSNVAQVMVVNRPIPVALSEGQGVRFRPLSTGEGISQTTAVAGVQDDLGFLWFATPFGLNRYDGYSFKTYKHEMGNQASLACSNVRTLFKDHAGNLWAACDESLDRFNPREETFTHYFLPAPGASGQLVKITSIQEDGRHVLWITTHSGLYTLNPATGQTQRFAHDPSDPTTLNNDNVDSMIDDQGQYSWVNAAKELNRFDRNLGKVTSHVTFTVPHTILDIHTAASGTTWITRSDPQCSIAQLDMPTRSLNCFNIEDSDGHSVMHGGTYSMFEDKNGTMWFATSVDGLMHYDPKRKQIVRYKSEHNDDWSLRSDNLQFVMEDRDGSMWAALHTGGIERFSLADPQIQTFTQKRGNIAGSLVTSIYQDHRGVLWIGSFGALNRIDRLHGLNEISQGPGLNGDVFLTMLEDPKGRLLAGTYRDSIQELDVRSGKFKKPIVSPEVARYPITRLLFDEHGILWAASKAGLLRIDPNTGKPELYLPDDSPVEFSDIKEDGHGYFWLSGNAGLHRFDPQSKTFRAYKRLRDQPWEISDNLTNFVHIDRAGQVWVGTQSGLAQLDPASGFFTNYYQSDGLAGEVVGGILEDGHGNLWIGTNHGISRFNLEKRKFTTIYVGDGVTEPNLTGGSACFQGQDGEMFFGGYGGVTAFHPDEMVDDQSAPAVALTDFQIGGAPVFPGKGSPLSAAITYSDSVILKHSQNIVSVGFAALNFKDPAHTRYRYQLEGLDQGWHEATSAQRIATYTTLPAGAYRLRVQASTTTSPWTAPGIALRVTILPAWWNTWWFRSLYLMLMILMLWIAYRYRLRAMSDALALRLQERVDERSRLSRELHDTLMQTIEGSRLIVHTATLPQTDPAQQGEALDKLSSWLDRASDEGRAAMETLRGSTNHHGDLYYGLRQTVDESAGQHKVQIVFPTPASRRAVRPFVQEEAFHIGSEAIRNACLHADATRIEIELRFEPDLLLRVKDDGRGMSSAVASMGREGHFGLACMRERASRIGARLSIDTAPGAGTAVTLRVSNAIAFETEDHDAPRIMDRVRLMFLRLKQFVRWS